MLSHTGHVMTLANSIIGVGILAMPFCFQKCGIFLAIFLLIISNWVTRICCHYLIKSSLLTRRKSFEFLGFHAFGSSGKLLVELCIIGYLLGTCITYFVVVGDLGPQIIMKMFTFDSIHTHLRPYFMLAITVLCVLPLAMLKNVDSLSTVCTASIGFYVCLVIKIILESESHILANDWTENVAYWRPAGLLQCLPIFSMALSCQMQLFEVFKSVNNQSVEKLNGIVRDATWICTFVYIAVGFFGYVAFCTQTFSGNILLNFSPSFGSDVIKIGFILSVAFSFPLIIFPCRASIYSLLYRKGHTDGSGGYIPETRFKTITAFIVVFTLCIALLIPSVELIIGLVGSTIGVAICIMFPAACFRKITKKNTSDRSFALSGIILASGFCLMVLGTYANLQAIDEHSSGAHLEGANLPMNIIKPTDISMIKANVQRLLEEEKKIADGKITNLENPKLPQVGLVVEKNENEKIQANVKAVASRLPPLAPVLPVDESHDKEKNKPSPIKDELVGISKPLDEKVIKPIIEMMNPMTNANNSYSIIVQKPDGKSRMPLPDLQIQASADSVSIKAPNTGIYNITQQTIDKEAIKKDEEIAAEERNGKIPSKNTEDELKKTQNELKKTKELLERKVDEIKEELAKQNKETQNLVVGKLEEVVEKVQKIEREVQKKDGETKPELPVPMQPSVASNIPKDIVVEKLVEVAQKVENIEREVQRNDNKGIFEAGKPVIAINAENKSVLLDKITSSSLQNNIQNKEKYVKAQVYEPLSYKTGELIENSQNSTKIEQNVPLPLPLLINASRINIKDVETIKIEAELNNLATFEKEKSNAKSISPVNSIQPKLDVESKKPQSLSKENVEAIRRDILELSSDKLVTTASPSNDLTDFQKRLKRSIDIDIPDFKAIDMKFSKENCLREPKVETLLQYGSSGAIDFKMQAIGRELKSLQNDKREKT